MLSLDFLAGFTIFLLALIMVVNMVPGLLAGLESSGIDYDAVAYRTGVILAEDPGWPANPPWESYDRDNKSKIQRMGLAISRETPNILLSTKIEKFFENASTADPFFSPGDYRDKVIFGDIPYSYNISLRSLDGTYDNRTGDPLPEGYGYIRRVVKIKEPGVAVIDESFGDQYIIPDPSHPKWNSIARNFTIRLDFSQLLNQTISPTYQIDPRIEPVNVTITDFERYLNDTISDIDGATLKNVTFLKGDSTRPDNSFSPFPYGKDDMEYYTLSINGTQIPYSSSPNATISSSISFELNPAAIHKLFEDNVLDPSNILDIQFNFEDDPPHTNITGIYCYDYNAPNVTHPDLRTGVLEVAIW